jgi:hypothetical protein
VSLNRQPLQSFEDNYSAMVKFASVDPDDPQKYQSDVDPEYEGFFDDIAAIAPGWQVSETAQIETRREGPREAWRLSGPAGELAATRHETGLEILGAAAALGGLFSLGLDLWDRWRTRRKEAAANRQPIDLPGGYRIVSPPSTDAFVVECRSVNSDGAIVQWRVTVPASRLTHELVASLLNDPHCASTEAP